MDSAVKLVGEYGSRDNFIRLGQYLGKVLSGSERRGQEPDWLRFPRNLGACRTVLRLFDDVPYAGLHTVVRFWETGQ
ncbi:hypothetical protein DPMN_128700 [Dreissena polymorpha]|uniref:Uncharacterized protein n=1 Tax=Dreissena polymorpha TaxID=45954 RepID=A0A9D4K0E9_DREPO|nr:hypothetical protein DPMN_128700 [Dreissena polymorpha]